MPSGIKAEYTKADLERAWKKHGTLMGCAKELKAGKERVRKDLIIWKITTDGEISDKGKYKRVDYSKADAERVWKKHGSVIGCAKELKADQNRVRKDLIRWKIATEDEVSDTNRNNRSKYTKQDLRRAWKKHGTLTGCKEELKADQNRVRKDLIRWKIATEDEVGDTGKGKRNKGADYTKQDLQRAWKKHGTLTGCTKELKTNIYRVRYDLINWGIVPKNYFDEYSWVVEGHRNGARLELAVFNAFYDAGADFPRIPSPIGWDADKGVDVFAELNDEYYCVECKYGTTNNRTVRQYEQNQGYTQELEPYFGKGIINVIARQASLDSPITMTWKLSTGEFVEAPFYRWLYFVARYPHG